MNSPILTLIHSMEAVIANRFGIATRCEKSTNALALLIICFFAGPRG
jgi:hypothetical protein